VGRLFILLFVLLLYYYITIVIFYTISFIIYCILYFVFEIGGPDFEKTNSPQNVRSDLGFFEVGHPALARVTPIRDLHLQDLYVGVVVCGVVFWRDTNTVIVVFARPLVF